MYSQIKATTSDGVKLDYKAPKLYDVVPKEEIAEFEEVMRETIADIVSEASGLLPTILVAYHPRSYASHISAHIPSKQRHWLLIQCQL